MLEDMILKYLSMKRSAHVVIRMGQTIVVLCLAAIPILGCSEESNQAFLRSHDAIHRGMTMREVFEAGLADYMKGMGTKNVPGATLPERQPVSSNCARHVLDISYSGAFWVRVYCGMNSPSAPQLVPEETFDDRQAFLRALDADYASWARNMEFRVESPPRELFGIYDHYRFTTDQEGRVDKVSPVISSRPTR